MISITSLEYGDILPRLLAVRLNRMGVEYRIKQNTVFTGSGAELVSALTESLIRDIKPFELVRMQKLLPVSRRDRKRIVSRALELTENDSRREAVAAALEDYLVNNTHIILEGFLRFRLPFVTDEWAMALDRAAEEYMEELGTSKLADLFSVLFSSAGVSRPPMTDLILYPDGGFSLSCDDGRRIESAVTDTGMLISVLKDIAPKRISVYDLTGGGAGEIKKAISKAFGNTAFFFVRS